MLISGPGSLFGFSVPAVNFGTYSLEQNYLQNDYCKKLQLNFQKLVKFFGV